MANDVIGRCPCPQSDCEEVAAVYVAKRRGGHLYNRCPDCGLDQRVGAKVQQYLWDNTNWIDQAPKPPENVDTEKTVKQTETETVKKTVPDLEKMRPVADFDPSADLTQSEPSGEPSNKPKGKKRLFMGLGVGSIIVALVGIVWSV